jgi:hypothetical protein
MRELRNVDLKRLVALKQRWRVSIAFLIQQTRELGLIDERRPDERLFGLVRSTLTPAALANSASLSPSTAAAPHRVVSFINVVGCGTDASSPIRQNLRHVIESVTSRHNDS